MDLHLRCIATHPRAGSGGARTAFAFSSRHARLVTAAADVLIDQSTSSNALRAVIRLSAPVEKLVYVGGSGTFLAFLENGIVSSYAERTSGLRLVQERRIGGADRPVALAEGAKFGRFALFAKVDSPSLWCLPVADGGAMGEPFKLRSDIEGEQENVNFVGGMFAKVRGKVATKVKARICPIVAVATHPTLSFVAAAYTNGIIRVWDIARKEQRSHFDVQLLMAERIVDLAMHPTMPVVVVCTTQGRIMTFYVKSALYKRGDEPVLATSKTRDRKRRFYAMAFMPGSPSYLLLLTASRRIIVRMIDKGSMIVNSSRFPKASRPLSVNQSAVLSTAHAAALEDIAETARGDSRHAALLCEPAFGLIATSLDNSGNVYVFQQRAEGLPGIRRAVSSGLDTGFANVQGNAFIGPVIVDADSLVVQRGVLFSYELGTERASKLCVLPPGDCHRIEVARDAYGYCMAALLFYSGDDEVNASFGYAEGEPASRYVLCTRRGDTEAWNASEPGEGRSGCFLSKPGQHDRVMILASTGTMASLLSFAGSPQRDGGPLLRQSRGVQRFKFDGNRATKVFRTPFASWSAVLYHDADGKRLCVSRNAFGPHGGAGGSSAAAGSATQNYNVAEEFGMDDGTAFGLRDKEVVIDVRWQRLPTGPQNEQYLGAIMTDKRIYFVRDVLDPLSVFEFQRIERIVVPFAPPSFAWVGPSVMVLFGNSLVSVTLDGRSDLIAGVSRGENVTALVATLPDRIVYTRPSPKHALNSISISSRPYSAMSGRVRGMLSLPSPRSRSNSRYVENVRAILESQDVSQGSVELTKALIAHELSPIAYLLAVSEQGKFSMPPLKRAGFLGRMGDIRGALSIAESEYSRLPDAESFHEGTELYRLLQRILNMAFASGDFEVGRRCAALLGRKGTFSAFVDTEGGYAAIRSVVEFARANGNAEIAQVLRPLIEKSAKSSVATDSSLIPSRRELDNIRRAIQSVDVSSIPLGASDKTQVFINVAPGEDVNGNPVQASQKELASVVQGGVCDRLNMFQREVEVEFSGGSDVNYQEVVDGFGDMDMNGQDSHALEGTTPDPQGTGEQAGDSSDDEDLFGSGRAEARYDSGGAASASGGMVPNSDLPEATKHAAEETRSKLRQQKEHMNKAIQEGRVETHALMQAQRNTEPTGRAIPAVRAAEIRDRGMRKLDEGRLSSARKEFESALRAVQHGRQRGHDSPAELVNELVYYKLLAKVRIAMEEIRTSAHANTMAGRLTYTQLATALTTVPLHTAHRIEALIMATDANIVMGNFGTAAQTMQAIKEVGVPNDEVRASLRDKYAACSARGFMNAQPQAVPRLCYHSLRVITPGVREMGCNVCPARFLTDSGLFVGNDCPSCSMGVVTLL